MAKSYHETGGKLKREDGGQRHTVRLQKKRGAPAWDPGPQRSRSVIRPRRDRIMGSSIQLPSQRQVVTTHTIL